MVDNFDQIKELLHFPHDDSFYFVQILQRKKDHPGVRLGGSNNNSRLIKSYYITSKEKLEIHKEEMIKLCEVFNARAGINLNPRSRKKAAHAMLIKLAHQFQNEDFRGCSVVYDSVCGDYHSEMDKRWLVDIDEQDLNLVNKIAMSIETLQSEITNVKYNVLSLLPTKHGYHLITNPFNMDKFKQIHPEIEIHKNNPTLLYCL